MNNIGKGIIAGLAATFVLAFFMTVKARMGVLPLFDPIAMLTQMANDSFGGDRTRMMGWALHFLIGGSWGALFGAMNSSLPGRTELAKGLWLAAFAWLISVLGFMPAAHGGILGLKFGVLVPVALLAAYLVFGALLAWVYAQLVHVRVTQRLQLIQLH
jgi:hypothetical protein